MWRPHLLLGLLILAVVIKTANSNQCLTMLEGAYYRPLDEKILNYAKKFNDSKLF